MDCKHVANSIFKVKILISLWSVFPHFMTVVSVYEKRKVLSVKGAKVQDSRWMDDLQFYILFNSISLLSGWWVSDNERVCNGTLIMIEKFSPQEGLEPGTTRSVGQVLTHWATGAPPKIPVQHIKSDIIFALNIWTAYLCQ